MAKAVQKAVKDNSKLIQLLVNIGSFDKDSSGPMSLEERLRIASSNDQLLKQAIQELIQELGE